MNAPEVQAKTSDYRRLRSRRSSGAVAIQPGGEASGGLAFGLVHRSLVGPVLLWCLALIRTRCPVRTGESNPVESDEKTEILVDELTVRQWITAGQGAGSTGAG